jgi:acetylornithine/succinyldiaminopimelate/putrescine aminotransferase
MTEQIGKVIHLGTRFPNTLGKYFLEGLKRLAAKHPIVKEARGRGMLLALEFQPQDGFSAAAVNQALLESGFLVACNPARSFLRFDPSLTILKEDVDQLLQCLDEILSKNATISNR